MLAWNQLWQKKRRIHSPVIFLSLLLGSSCSQRVFVIFTKIQLKKSRYIQVSRWYFKNLKSSSINWQLLEQKYKLEDDFQELINFAEEKGCSDRDFLNDLHTTAENFLLEKKDDIANYIAAYRIQYRDFSIRIEQENCH